MGGGEEFLVIVVIPSSQVINSNAKIELHSKDGIELVVIPSSQVINSNKKLETLFRKIQKD